ncbi:MAG: COP23 domain-containing protein [Cyanobacteria bacterium P01_H01_bin.26]
MFKPRFSRSLLLALWPLATLTSVVASPAIAQTPPQIEVEVETVSGPPRPWGRPAPVVVPEVVIPEVVIPETVTPEVVAPAPAAPTVEIEEVEITLPATPGHKPSLAGTFACVESAYYHAPPTTVFYSPEGALPVIHWVSDYFDGSGYDPLTRCRAVSGRFQRYYEADVLNYITTGIVNRLPVICVTDQMGGPCQGVLLTLKPGQNASFVVQRLFDLSYGHQVGALYESGSRVYINVENYLSGLDHLESSL